MSANVVKMCALKHDLHAAPAYAYYFMWYSTLLNGRPGFWHTADLQFCFDNAKRCEQGPGNTPDAQALAKKMRHRGLRLLPLANPSSRALLATNRPDTNRTMIFDNECRMVNDPDGNARKIILA